ncbi:MAG: crossover junction endodeoxyribonuclease RuvC [Candidatus Andersenbacteria bacterium]
MIILGLDPGIARTGFGVLDTNSTDLFVRCGCLTTPQHETEEDRLLMLGEDLEQLVTDTRPDLAVVEKIFFGNNSKTAIITAQARGVLLYILRKHHITIESLTPLQIKSRLTGYGAAKKEQIQAAVTQQLHLSAIPQPDDAADALAAALSVV